MKEFAFLGRKRKRLKKELSRIDALEKNLKETRKLLKRAMNCIGSMTREEFQASEGCQYMKWFLEGKLSANVEEGYNTGEMT